MQYPDYHTFERLDPYSLRWKIKGRVCRIWQEYELMKYSTTRRILKLLLIDENGDQIQLTLQNNEIEMFGDSLSEGQVFSIDNVKVTDAPCTYRVAPSQWQLFLKKNSKVEKINDECTEIPNDRYYFKPLDQLSSVIKRNKYLIDVIGIVADVGGVSTVRKRDGQHTKKMDIIIFDASENVLSLTLWGGIITTNEDKLSGMSENGNTIIATSVLAREYNGKLYLSSSYSTKLLINSEIRESEELRSWYVENESKCMNLILQVKGQTTPTNASRMTVVECLDTKNDSGTRDIVIAIKATIFRMEIDQKIWYSACNRCGKKVIINNSFKYCQLCGISNPRTHPRYIMRLVVIDQTGTLNVVIFDRDVEKILATSAADLSQLITSEVGNEVIEQKVQRAFWKSYIFHIKASQIKDVRQPYPVTRICDINYEAESRRLLSLISNLDSSTVSDDYFP